MAPLLSDLAASPWLWFFAIAILPGLGVPNCPLMLACGTLLSVPHGIDTAAAVAIIAVNANILWTYWAAALSLRRRLQKPVNRRARQLLDNRFQLSERGVLWITFLLHITPGVPLFVQNYYPGLNRLAFWKYLAIAVPIQTLYTGLIVVTSGQIFTALKSSPLILATAVLVLATAFTLRSSQRSSSAKSPAV